MQTRRMTWSGSFNQEKERGSKLLPTHKIKKSIAKHTCEMEYYDTMDIAKLRSLYLTSHVHNITQELLVYINIYMSQPTIALPPSSLPRSQDTNVSLQARKGAERPLLWVKCGTQSARVKSEVARCLTLFRIASYGRRGYACEEAWTYDKHKRT